jgi:phage tail sheath protein FI
MPEYRSPGVFVEEVDTGAHTITAVGTSTAGFIGEAPLASAPADKAIPIDNWTQFRTQFIGDSTASTPLANAVYGFFLNGGARCYVVNTKGPIAPDGKGLGPLSEIDEIAIIAAPGMTDAASYDALLTSAETLRDRVAILDGPETVSDIDLLGKAVDMSSSTAAGKDESTAEKGGKRARQSDRGYGAYYFPWLRARDVVTNSIVSIAPSGHIAGIYARTDTERGVHKAPANVVIRGALGVTRVVSQAEQGQVYEFGVNCIRWFTREGALVWGARTLAQSASNWRYLNVRRLFTMVEESISRNTRWIVFEPNDRPLWKSIQRDVGAFLTLLWRQGALQGASAREAFFVKCDEETNTQEDIDQGRVIILIGMAPVKPAEFVIFRIGQSQAGTKVEAA